MKFNFYADPSHGWVKVPLKTLQKLNIDQNISSFSYIHNTDVSLEEDNDLVTFLRAMQKIGKQVEFNEFHTDRASKIRNYPIYKKEKYKQ